MKLLFGSKARAFGQWALLMVRHTSLAPPQILAGDVGLLLSLVLGGTLHLVKQSRQREVW